MPEFLSNLKAKAHTGQVSTSMVCFQGPKALVKPGDDRIVIWERPGAHSVHQTGAQCRSGRTGQPAPITSKPGDSDAPGVSQCRSISRQQHSWRNTKFGSVMYKNFGKQELFSKKNTSSRKNGLDHSARHPGRRQSRSQSSTGDRCHSRSTPAPLAECSLWLPQHVIMRRQKGPLNAPEHAQILVQFMLCHA